MTTLDDTPVTELRDSSCLTLVDLSVVEQDDGYIVGDSASADFVELPREGVVAIRHLTAGLSIADTVQAMTADGYQDVDVLDFAHTLIELGFVTGVDGTPTGRAAASADRWLKAPRIPWLFGRTAWALYGSLLLGSVTAIAAAPQLRPRAGDLFFLPDPLASLALLTVLSWLLTAGHECFHWLAAANEGLAARFSVGRRLYFLVFETDLTLLWSLPRHRRYGPLLAGIAFDSITLATTLATRLAAQAAGAPAANTFVHLVAGLGFLTAMKIIWQGCLFMRNDLYAVLITRLGCVNLWQTATLTLKQRLYRLNADERLELATAHPRDLRHARWYAWLTVVGAAIAAWFAATQLYPVLDGVFQELVRRISAADSAAAWGDIVLGAVLLFPYAVMLALLARQITRRLRATGSGPGPGTPPEHAAP